MLIEIQEVAPQLWVSQTLKLVRAYHQKGTFQGPEVEDIANKIKTQEGGNQRDLRKLAALINKILNMAKGCGGNGIVKYDDKGDKLIASKVDRKKMLLKDLYSRQGDLDNSEAKTNTAGAESTEKSTDRVETKTDGKEHKGQT